MRLISLQEAGTPSSQEQVFRTSPMRDIIAAIVLLICILGCVGLYAKVIFFDRQPVPLAAHIFALLLMLWFVLWLGLMFFMAIIRAEACNLPTNWLLRLYPGRVYINFRSFQNHACPDTDTVVLELTWKEISRARQVKETSHRGRDDDRLTEFFTYLDLFPDLNREQFQQIAEALQIEQKRKPTGSPLESLRHELFMARKQGKPKQEIRQLEKRIQQLKFHKPKVTSGAKYHDIPVRLMNDRFLRLRWNAIRPGISDALQVLSIYTEINEPISIVTDSSVQLAGKELEDMILERLSRGDKFEAIELVKVHYGKSSDGARQFIEELSSQRNQTG